MVHRQVTGKPANRVVREGWERCLKARPANLMSPELKTSVSLGNLEDDFEAVGKADWILEAVVENLKIKQDLMVRIDAARKPDFHRQHEYIRHSYPCHHGRPVG